MTTSQLQGPGNTDAPSRPLWKEPIFVAVLGVIVVIGGGMFVLAVLLLPSPSGQLTLFGWGAERRFSWATGIFNTLLGAGGDRRRTRPARPAAPETTG